MYLEICQYQSSSTTCLPLDEPSGFSCGEKELGRPIGERQNGSVEGKPDVFC